VVVEAEGERVALVGVLADDDLADAALGDLVQALLDGVVVLAIAERRAGGVSSSASTARLDELGQRAGARRRESGDFGRLEHQWIADAREGRPGGIASRVADARLGSVRLDVETCLVVADLKITPFRPQVDRAAPRLHLSHSPLGSLK